MRVQELMRKDVKICKDTDNVNTAAKLMWDHGCGTLPVIGKDEKVIGMITDRDICMAAYTQGKLLADIPVKSCMSRSVFTAKPTDDLAAAEKLMQANGVRRIPVVSDKGTPVGIISLDDLARRINGGKELPPVTEKEVAQTFAGICCREPAAAKAD